ncbi:MAG: RNA polymerase sigma factor [Actinomyces sp.]|nr:MAG: RNA polymerase sigma factor [Actinomyces sp.]
MADPAPPTGDTGAPASGATGPDAAALERMVERHAATVYRFALSIVHDAALADDVVQETLIRAWRRGPVSDDGEVPRAWLMKVARNTAISILRGRRDELPGPAHLPEEAVGVTTDRVVEGRAALDGLWAALGVLDPDDRLLVVLREIDGHTYDEIAEILDLPLPTVKTRLFRARRTLKTALKEWR